MTTPQKNANTFFTDGCGRCSLMSTPKCKVQFWKAELFMLRKIALSSGLNEELKWGQACYTFHGKNIFLISAFKENCVIGFFKGALLNNIHNMLQKPGENSQASRMLKFNTLQEIVKAEKHIRSFIVEAIEIEKSGKKIEFKKMDEYQIPKELEMLFSKNKPFQKAFQSLTPGRQRGYLIYFSQAKQSSTRTSRIERCTPKIMAGKGWNE